MSHANHFSLSLADSWYKDFYYSFFFLEIIRLKFFAVKINEILKGPLFFAKIIARCGWNSIVKFKLQKGMVNKMEFQILFFSWLCVTCSDSNRFIEFVEHYAGYLYLATMLYWPCVPLSRSFMCERWNNAEILSRLDSLPVRFTCNKVHIF